MNLFLLLLGILLTSIGLMFILLYTNLLTMGYSFFKFVYRLFKLTTDDLNNLNIFSL